jgi:hypothetical protein
MSSALAVFCGWGLFSIFNRNWHQSGLFPLSQLKNIAFRILSITKKKRVTVKSFNFLQVHMILQQTLSGGV